MDASACPRCGAQGSVDFDLVQGVTSCAACGAVLDEEPLVHAVFDGQGAPVGTVVRGDDTGKAAGWNAGRLLLRQQQCCVQSIPLQSTASTGVAVAFDVLCAAVAVASPAGRFWAAYCCRRGGWRSRAARQRHRAGHPAQQAGRRRGGSAARVLRSLGPPANQRPWPCSGTIPGLVATVWASQAPCHQGALSDSLALLQGYWR